MFENPSFSAQELPLNHWTERLLPRDSFGQINAANAIPRTFGAPGHHEVHAGRIP